MTLKVHPEFAYLTAPVFSCTRFPVRFSRMNHMQEQPKKLVTVLAVGIKDGNRVLIGGTEIEL